MLFRVHPRHRVVGSRYVGELVVALAGMAFQAVPIGVGGWLVGGLVFGFAGDPLDEFGHDGKAGAEDYGCEFAHAVDLVSMIGKRVESTVDRETLTSIDQL